MNIEQAVYDKYPVLFDESQCASLKRTRDGLRDNYRARLQGGLTYETKEHEPVVSEPRRNWFGEIIETK